MSARRLLLDAHGVVLNNPLPGFLEDLALATSQSPAALMRRWKAQWRRDAWLGRVSDTRLWQGLTLDRGQEARWSRCLEARYRPGPAARHLTRWGEQAELWLLSNHRSGWLQPRLARFDLETPFTSILVSDEIGALKPEREAFEAALVGLGDGERVLFVDDQWRNVEAARRLGIRAVQAERGCEAWVAEVDNWLTGGIDRGPDSATLPARSPAA